MPGIGDVTGMSVETNYDLMKLFHQYKPIRSGAAQKDPTVINVSWGYRAGFLFSGLLIINSRIRLEHSMLILQRLVR